MWFPAAKCLQAALEAHSSNLKIRFFGSLVHQPADTVVSDKVHHYFFSDHLGCFTPQDIHTHGRLNIAEKQLDIPPLEVKFGKFIRRILLGIKQGGNNVKPLSAKPGILHRDLDLSQHQLFRKLRPIVFRVRQSDVINWAVPFYQQIVRTELFVAACGVDRCPPSKGDNTVNALFCEFCDVVIAAETFVSQEDVASLKGRPLLTE